MSLQYIQKNGGAVIYLQQEGRGIGLANKVAAYALQDVGMDTVDANIHLGFPEDCRHYGVVPGILEDMAIESIQLMTNNPRKVHMLRHLGIHVVGTIPMVVTVANDYNRKYLQTKKDRMNHANFGDILFTTTTPNSPPTKTSPRNGFMAPFKPSTTQPEHQTTATTNDQLLEEDEEEKNVLYSTKNIITQTLVNDETDQNNNNASGVRASANGYCFGRKSVEDAIAAVARGELVVVVDDEDRENEGDFIMAADAATPQTLATIVRYSSGVICVGMEGSRMDELHLPAMVSNNQDPKGTAFSITVDANGRKYHGFSTGISALDRATTIQLLASPNTMSSDLVRPGHIFPLRAWEGGVLARDGHTEASVDLARLAGRQPCGVLCEIVSEESPEHMARLPELRRFCQRHGFVMTSIVDIAQYRRDTEQ